jgi:RNA polymerase sigma factor (sigma-70 family)
MSAAFSGVLWHLRQAAFGSDGASRTDSELLDLFRSDRDEAAFAALVRRHGPMVFGVCRRTLRNDADAEDAFQATFLVLARKAHDVRPAGQVGHWLYGVAYNTARKARVSNRRRIARERRAGEERLPDDRRDNRSDLHEALDIELSRLPDKFRAPVVLCDLEGEPLKEAARRLDCPTGTVASRLARARAMLRQNLARRGVGLAALIAPGVATASVPAKLAMQTTRAATGVAPISTSVLKLTEGVIDAMFLTKVKSLLIAVVAAGVLVAGIGNGLSPVIAEQDKPTKPGAAKTDKPVKPGADTAKPDKPVKPDKPAGDVKKAPGFTGTVKSVDANSITLAVTKGDQSIEKTFNVAKDATVKIDGREGKLADVKAGLHASVKLGDDKTTVVAIGCDGPTLIGELKEVSAEKKTVKVAVTTHTDKTDPKAVKVEEKSVNVADDVRMVVEGNKQATLADLKTGSTVMVQMSADGERAVLIMSPAKGGADGPSVVGELKSIASDKKSVKVAVTVKDKSDPKTVKVEERTIALSEKVRFVVEGNKQATLADLKPGASVWVQLAKGGEQAVLIMSPAKGGGDKKPEKPIKPEKPVKPGADPTKPVKPDAIKPGADPVKPVKPVKPAK